VQHCEQKEQSHKGSLEMARVSANKLCVQAKLKALFVESCKLRQQLAALQVKDKTTAFQIANLIADHEQAKVW
jgi:hypothetical protein